MLHYLRLPEPTDTPNAQGAIMDPQELRLSCLQMAYELGGKPDAILSAANDLINFVTKGPAGEAAPAPELATADEVAAQSSVAAPEQTADDRIAACGTALEMPESGDLAQAEPAAEAPGSSGAVASEDKAAEGEHLVSADAEDAAPAPAISAEPEAEAPEKEPSPMEPEANGSEAAAAVEAEAVAAVVGLGADAAPSSEDQATEVAPVT
jgi:hypothetical protein